MLEVLLRIENLEWWNEDSDGHFRDVWRALRRYMGEILRSVILNKTSVERKKKVSKGAVVRGVHVQFTFSMEERKSDSVLLSREPAAASREADATYKDTRVPKRRLCIYVRPFVKSSPTDLVGFCTHDQIRKYELVRSLGATPATK